MGDRGEARECAHGELVVCTVVQAGVGGFSGTFHRQ